MLAIGAHKYAKEGAYAFDTDASDEEMKMTKGITGCVLCALYMMQDASAAGNL